MENFKLPGNKGPVELSQLTGHAERLWKFLDDLAAENPDGYKAFLEQQAKAAGLPLSTSQEKLAATSKQYVPALVLTSKLQHRTLCPSGPTQCIISFWEPLPGSVIEPAEANGAQLSPQAQSWRSTRIPMRMRQPRFKAGNKGQQHEVFELEVHRDVLEMVVMGKPAGLSGVLAHAGLHFLSTTLGVDVDQEDCKVKVLSAEAWKNRSTPTTPVSFPPHAAISQPMPNPAMDPALAVQGTRLESLPRGLLEELSNFGTVATNPSTTDSNAKGAPHKGMIKDFHAAAGGGSAVVGTGGSPATSSAGGFAMSCSCASDAGPDSSRKGGKGTAAAGGGGSSSRGIGLGSGTGAHRSPNLKPQRPLIQVLRESGADSEESSLLGSVDEHQSLGEHGNEEELAETRQVAAPKGRLQNADGPVSDANWLTGLTGAGKACAGSTPSTATVRSLSSTATPHSPSSTNSGRSVPSTGDLHGTASAGSTVGMASASKSGSREHSQALLQVLPDTSTGGELGPEPTICIPSAGALRAGPGCTRPLIQELDPAGPSGLAPILNQAGGGLNCCGSKPGELSTAKPLKAGFFNHAKPGQSKAAVSIGKPAQPCPAPCSQDGTLKVKANSADALPVKPAMTISAASSLVRPTSASTSDVSHMNMLISEPIATASAMLAKRPPQPMKVGTSERHTARAVASTPQDTKLEHCSAQDCKPAGQLQGFTQPSEATLASQSTNHNSSAQENKLLSENYAQSTKDRVQSNKDTRQQHQAPLQYKVFVDDCTESVSRERRVRASIHLPGVHHANEVQLDIIGPQLLSLTAPAYGENHLNTGTCSENQAHASCTMPDRVPAVTTMNIVLPLAVDVSRVAAKFVRKSQTLHVSLFAA